MNTRIIKYINYSSFWIQLWTFVGHNRQNNNEGIGTEVKVQNGSTFKSCNDNENSYLWNHEYFHCCRFYDIFRPRPIISSMLLHFDTITFPIFKLCIEKHVAILMFNTREKNGLQYFMTCQTHVKNSGFTFQWNEKNDRFFMAERGLSSKMIMNGNIFSLSNSNNGRAQLWMFGRTRGVGRNWITCVCCVKNRSKALIII